MLDEFASGLRRVLGMDRTRLTAPRPQRGAGVVWTRRKSAAPTVTLETKLVALRAMVGAERMWAEAAFVGEAMPFLRTICRWYNGPDLATEDLEAEALWPSTRPWARGRRAAGRLTRMPAGRAHGAGEDATGIAHDPWARAHGTVVVGAVLHGLDNDRGVRPFGANVGPELAMALTDTACSEAGMAERRGDAEREAEREAECAALAEAVAALSDADQAVVAAWQAGKVRALPRGCVIGCEMRWASDDRRRCAKDSRRSRH